jgi:hypothetical protein
MGLWFDRKVAPSCASRGFGPMSWLSTKAYDVPVLRLKRAFKLNFGKEDGQRFSCMRDG